MENFVTLDLWVLRLKKEHRMLYSTSATLSSKIKVELCTSLGKWHIIDSSLNIFVGITCPYSVNYVFCCWILKTDKCSHLTFILPGGYLNFSAWHIKKWISFEQKKDNIILHTNTDPFVIVSVCCVLPHTDHYPAGSDTWHSINTEWVLFISYVVYNITSLMV